MPLLKQALILVGGRGTRLGSLTKNTPKPLLSVAKKPFIEHLLQLLSEQKFSDVILLAGCHGEQFKTAYHGKNFNGSTIRVIVEEAELGTAGAIKNVDSELLDDIFVTMNGDSYFDINIREMELLSQNCADIVISIRKVNDIGRYGRIVIDTNSQITQFDEKLPASAGKPGLINGGIYMMKKSVLDLIDNSPCSIENDVIPKLVKTNKAYGIVFNDAFIDIGTPETYKHSTIFMEKIS